MITRQDLLDAGYNYSFQSMSFRQTHELYQKRIRNERGETRYFMNFWWYDATASIPHDAWESEVYFVSANGENFTVSLEAQS